MGDNKKLYLVRHAESYNNIKGVEYICDSELTDLGLKQATEISKYFDDDITLIIHSRFKRTKQTADFTIHRFPNAEIREWNVHEFNYLGELNSSIVNKEKRKNEKSFYWEQAELYYRYNDVAESFNDFLKRVEKFILDIEECDKETIAVFSHKYFINGILWYALTKNSKKYYSLLDFNNFCKLYFIGNGSIVSCLINGNKIFIGNIKDVRGMKIEKN